MKTNREILIENLQEGNIEMIWKSILLARMTCNKCSKDKSFCTYCNHEFLREWLDNEYKGKEDGKSNKETTRNF